MDPVRYTSPQREDRDAPLRGWVESGLVFAAENGAALDPEPVSRYWRRALKKAMPPTIRPHDLRHTHATFALQAGTHPRVCAPMKLDLRREIERRSASLPSSGTELC